MKKQIFSIIITSLFTLTSCHTTEPEKPWKELPTVTELSQMPQTEFVPTLENSVSKDKNSVYAPALLYAWSGLRTELESDIKTTNTNSQDLNYLNHSTSWKNALDSGEYKITSEIDGSLISIRSFFNKTMPFPSVMDKLEEPIIFKGTKVAGFGMEWQNEDIINFSRILYYRSDDAFVLKFNSKNQHEEIILVKGFNTISDLAEAVTITNELIVSGETEMQDLSQRWKYDFNREDIFFIPVIKFNIATNYKTMEGQKFKTNGINYTITKAYQQTGFILNETGAVVESEAVLEVAAAEAAVPELEKPHPKKMIFDKPFLIIIRKKNRPHPFFVLKIENAELMQKE